MSPLSSTPNGPQALRAFLRDLGYTDTLIRANYPVSLDNAVSQIDLVGFGRASPKDMTTATLAAFGSGKSHSLMLAAAHALACPAAVAVVDGHLELWKIAVDPQGTRRIDTVPIAEYGRLVDRFRADLGPDALLGAKSHGRQLTLFPVDVSLLANSRLRSSERLSGRVEEAMSYALQTTSSPDQEGSAPAASRAVLGVLAALVLRDKLELGAEGSEVLDTARKTFPRYFEWLPPLNGSAEQRLSGLVGILGEGINYEGMDSRVISEVYEHAIVSRATRLQLGIFYTPPELARRVVAHIPFEELPPDDRVVLDPACGSGTLLLAAHDRLQDLVPVRWDPANQHEYLVSHLSGYDLDPFAVEIARLSLFLHALPAGNRWDIRQRDARSSEVPRRRPTVVLSNPPWLHQRKEGTRRQLADEFLLAMLRHVKPGGFIAAVLPAGWLSTGTSRATRELLQEQTDLFEVWRLPDRVFEMAENAPCVILARSTRPSMRPWTFRRVLSKRALEQFYETGTTEELTLARPGRELQRGTLLRGPLDAAHDLLAGLPRLGSVATVKSGLAPRPPVASHADVGEFLWLQHASDLPGFGAVGRSRLRRAQFPGDFVFGGTYDATLLRRRKVLVSASRAERNPWRLKVGVDLIGVIPSNTMHMVLPARDREGDIYALLAVLGSWVASAWIDSYDTKRAVGAALLRALPVPSPGPVWRELEAVGRELVGTSPDELADVARFADEVVSRAYNLPPAVLEQLMRHFGGFIAPEGWSRYPATVIPPAPDGVVTRRFGAVLAVEGDLLRVWVPGITDDDGTLISVPNRFLGWHCIEGATFEVDSVNDDLATARYFFQARSYEQLDELLRRQDSDVAI